MAKNDRSNYQKQVVNDYYKNLDNIMLEKLQTLVTDLYLADSQKKKDALWKKAEAAMQKLAVPNMIIKHIISKKNVEILAKNLQDWLKKLPKK